MTNIIRLINKFLKFCCCFCISIFVLFFMFLLGDVSIRTSFIRILTCVHVTDLIKQLRHAYACSPCLYGCYFIVFNFFLFVCSETVGSRCGCCFSTSILTNSMFWYNTHRFAVNVIVFFIFILTSSFWSNKCTRLSINERP